MVNIIFVKNAESSLEERDESNAVLRSELSQQEDVKLYIQLPEYDAFRGYDLGNDEQLEKAAALILRTSICHRGGTLKHHISRLRRHDLFRKIKTLAAKWQERRV